MATTFDALLRIKALVQGEGDVQKLASRLGGLQATAGKVSSGFRGMATAAGGLGAGLQALIPLASGAGMIALAQRSIEAGDNLFDMSQKTGIAVEQLSRFSKAGRLAGIDIDSIGKGVVKFNRTLAEGKANEALAQLGISSQDASGKLRATDQIMLDIADRFSKMPDGAQKTALAMQLFGRSGAEMIPMLNMGRQEIEKFTGMSATFAAQADKTSDSLVTLQMKIGAIGGKIAAALMPGIEAATNGMTIMVDAFMKLPGPLQTIISTAALVVIAFAPLLGVISNLVLIGTALSGLQLGATIASWAGLAVPAIASMTTAFTGFLAFLTGTVGPAILAFFSGPAGWTVLAIAAVVAMCVAFREPITRFLSWFGQEISKAMTGLTALLNTTWQSVTGAFSQYVVTPIVNSWNNLAKLIPDAMSKARDQVVNIWNGLTAIIRSVVNNAIGMINRAINGSISTLNNLITKYNDIPVLPNVPLAQAANIPQFARGAYVTRRTIAEIGEGGEPEYVVPASKSLSFAANIAAGKTGPAALDPMSIGSLAPTGGFVGVLQKLAALRSQGVDATFSPLTGLVVRRRLPLQRESGGGGMSMAQSMAPAATASPAGPIVLNVQTGPVMEFNGQRFVSYDDLERAMRATAEGVVGRLRTPAARLALGR